MAKFQFRRIFGLADGSDADRKGVDEQFYSANYYDVAMSGMSAVDHYYGYGWMEGRNPSPEFHTLFYASQNMSGGELSSNPLTHYAQAKREGSARVSMSPPTAEGWAIIQKSRVAYYFDEHFYRLKYAAELNGLEPIDHYFLVGWRKGYDPNTKFNTKAYLKTHSYIQNSDVNPFYHYIVVGKSASERTEIVEADEEPANAEAKAKERAKQLRIVAPHFDAAYYLDKNTDVADAKLNPLTHYFDYGWREGRNPSQFFWTKYYLTRYPEVALAGVNPLIHYLTSGKDHGYRPNPMSGEKWSRPVAPSDEEWLKACAAVDQDGLEVSVIVPVYKGYNDTLAAIYSVLTNAQKTKFDLIVVNDRGPEPELTEKLRALAERKLFIYVENSENIGFVRTVNKALKMRPDNDVVLLNADTLVYSDWLDRLLQLAKDEPEAATITPMSNNASICSYPEAKGSNVLALECSREELDRFGAVCNKGQSVRLPTGVGFCFYMRRSVINEIGDLDLVFGRGYGEENDFCTRALKAGYKNLLAADVFVYHSGQVSFDEFRVAEYGPGQKALSLKHPDYGRRVESFVQADSARRTRERLDLYRLARSCGPKSAVLLSIDSSGGIVTHIASLATRLEETGLSVVVIYLGGETATVRRFDKAKEIYTPNLEPININVNVALIAEFLDWLDPEIVHAHSFALLKWRSTQLIMAMLAARERSGFYFTAHDYDSICHLHHLVDREGRYCEKMSLELCRSCVRTDGLTTDGVDPGERQEVYGKFLSRARAVFVPSEDTAKRMSQHFPGVVFTVREHEEHLPDHAFLQPRASTATLRIVSIGAIGPHKGSDILYALALDAKLRSLPIQYLIVGYSAIPDKMKEVGVFETGRYSSLEQCMDVIEKLEPHFSLFASIWPETYCYTLSIALALGLPPIVFDLGAQADRVNRAGYGVVLDPSLVFRPEALNDALLELSVRDEWAKRRPVKFVEYENFVKEYYRSDN